MARTTASRLVSAYTLIAYATAARAETGTGTDAGFYVHVPSVSRGPEPKSAMQKLCDAAEPRFECIDVYDSGAYVRRTNASNDTSSAESAVRKAFGSGAMLGREVFQDIQGGKIHSQTSMPRAPLAVPTVSYLAGRDLLAEDSGLHLDELGADVNDVAVNVIENEPWHLTFLNARDRGRCKRSTREWGVCAARDENAYVYARSGAGVTVYMLGEGVNVDHVDFSNERAVRGFDLFPGDDSPCSMWQGTHVVSMINGLVHGVAKDARVVSVAVTPGCRRQMPVRNMVRGMQFVLDDLRARARADDRGPAVLYTVPRVNVRTTDTATVLVVEQLARALLRANVTIVSSTGAGRHDACGFTPQRLPEVIAPGALDVFRTGSGEVLARPWMETNYGTCVDLWAPGATIEGAFSPEIDATAVFSGTAQAGAITAGVAAMVLERDPTAPPARVRETIRRAAVTPTLMLYTRPNTTMDVLQVPLFT